MPTKPQKKKLSQYSWSSHIDAPAKPAAARIAVT